METSEIKQEFIQAFGEAYITFGLPKLMGRIVGLLIFQPEALSLDEITAQLQVSKGPVSQILKRLRDHKLIKRIWVPGDRKDYYSAEDEIFLQAFINQAQMFKHNLLLAEQFKKLAEESTGNGQLEHFRNRMNQMAAFNVSMQEYLTQFITEWQQRSR